MQESGAGLRGQPLLSGCEAEFAGDGGCTAVARAGGRYRRERGPQHGAQRAAADRLLARDDRWYEPGDRRPDEDGQHEPADGAEGGCGVVGQSPCGQQRRGTARGPGDQTRGLHREPGAAHDQPGHDQHETEEGDRKVMGRLAAGRLGSVVVAVVVAERCRAYEQEHADQERKNPPRPGIGGCRLSADAERRDPHPPQRPQRCTDRREWDADEDGGVLGPGRGDHVGEIACAGDRDVRDRRPQQLEDPDACQRAEHGADERVHRRDDIDLACCRTDQPQRREALLAASGCQPGGRADEDQQREDQRDRGEAESVLVQAGGAGDDGLGRDGADLHCGRDRGQSFGRVPDDDR